MKSSILLTISMSLIGLLVVPAVIYAQEQSSANLPISQPLVREGTVALKLADALRLGTFSSEAEAESALGAAGIAPRNGWIADYPVTPDIVGELQGAVAEAANYRRIPMDRDGAVKAFQDVIVAYDLSVKPSAGQTAGNVPSYVPDQTVINNYYYDEGPPVVTYYTPPPDYAYLYAWVPYPFWWTGFWFPGFFVLADFDIHVHHRHFHDGDDFHHFRDRDGDHFSNHFRDSRTGAVSRIDPANRSRGGTFPTRTSSGWTSASAQNGARSIFNSRTNSGSGTGWRQRTALPSVNGATVRSGSNVSSGTRTSNASFSNARPYYSGRTFTQSSGGSRTFNTYRGSSFRSSGSTQTFQPKTGSSSSSGWRSGSVGSSSRSFGGWHSSGGGMRSSGGWRR